MAKIHPNSLETLAVTRITTIAMQPGTVLEPSIPTGDKGVSFDGHISVYKDDSLKKSALVGRVPVQVKGKAVKKFSAFQIKYSKVELDDLRNYYMEGGVIYFVCEVNEDGKVEVFAKMLLPLDLRVLIDKYGGQQTTTINLNHINNMKTLTFICNQFLKEQIRQPVGHIGKHSFDSRKFEEYKVSRVAFAPSTEQSVFVNHDMYLYGVDGGIEFPISLMKFEKIGREGTTYIDIKGMSIPYNYTWTELSDTDEIILEHSFSITFNRKSRLVKFKILKFFSLESYRKVFMLLEKFENGESLSLFNGAIEFTSLKMEASEFREIVREEKTHLENMVNVYDKIGIPHTYVSNGTNKNLNDYIQHLFGVFIEGNYDSINMDKISAGMTFFRLGEDYILAFYSPNEVEKIQSVAGETFRNKEILIGFDETSEKFKVSPFLLIDPKDLFTAANVTFELVKDSFQPNSHDYNESTFTRTNQFCLDCLKAYDNKKRDEYLYLVEIIYNHIKDSDIEVATYNISTINYYQTLYRLNKKLLEEQLQKIVEIKEVPQNSKNILLRLCCNVLLNNTMESKHYFKMLELQQKEEFITYPIYTLYKQVTEN